MFDIESALRMLIERDGSDLHIKVGSPPMARIHGHLGPLMDVPPLEPEQTEVALDAIIPSAKLRQEFGEVGEADFAYAIPGVSRFRVNAFRQRGSVSIACRAIPFAVRTIDELGLPQVVRDLADSQRGIVLLTGTTGSGKSTTLAAMIDHINSNRARHIVTLEDPIEYLHADKQSIINQREVGADTESFARAMRRVLRQDPDVILIGEMRDEETVRTALSAAETGHLVLSTLHTLDASETINRIIDFFPPHLQQQARVMLASTLRGAISQRLVPTADNSNRVAVAEIMVATGRVKDLILQPNETGKIGEVISEGAFYGMQTFDQDLLKHVQAGRISEAVAMDTASSPHDFKLMLAAGGQRASGIEQIMGNGDETAEVPVPPVPPEQAAPEQVPAAPVPAAPAPSAPPAAPAGNGSAAPPGPPPGA
jgi:twitching motility protein PilT